MKSNRILLINYIATLIFICLPFVGFVTRGNFLEIENLDIEIILSSLSVSLISSIISMALIFVIGLPVGYYMAKNDFKFKSVLDLLFNLPQVLPPAVIGLLLLITYGNNGFIGRHMIELGIRMSFSTLGVIMAFVFVSLPIFIKGTSVAFSNVDPCLEESALILGDSPQCVFCKISLPLAKEGILVAFLMAWSRGISEFGATMMFAGNLTGVTQTLPLAIYTTLETNFNNALFLSFIMFVIALMVLICTYLLLMKKKDDKNVSI